MGKGYTYIADTLLTVMHEYWKDNVFDLKKSKLIADFPEFEEPAAKFYLDKLETSVKQVSSLEELFQFAVICEITTYPSSGTEIRRMLLRRWGANDSSSANETSTENNALPVALAYIGLVTQISKVNPIVSFPYSSYPTEYTIKKFGKSYSVDTRTFLSQILGKSYIPSDTIDHCWNCYTSVLSGRHLPQRVAPYHWFFPVSESEEFSLSGYPGSYTGTKVNFSFGILVE